MKMALIALIFCLSLNSISSLEVLNGRSNHTSNIYHSASHLQGLSYQERNQLNNVTIPHRHNGVVAYLRGNPYQQQADDVNNNQLTVDNRIVHPRFRALPQSPLLQSTIIASEMDNKDNIQQNLPLLADEKIDINTKNSFGLLQVLTTTKLIDKSAQTRRPFSFADYYQHHLKEFFGHKHDKVSPRTHYIKTGLRR